MVVMDLLRVEVGMRKTVTAGLGLSTTHTAPPRANQPPLSGRIVPTVSVNHGCHELLCAIVCVVTVSLTTDIRKARLKYAKHFKPPEVNQITKEVKECALVVS